MRALFIVNPKAGKGRGRDAYQVIENEAFKLGIECSRRFTERAGHARELAAAEGDFFEVVVAVGGDGTMNEVASGLIGKRAVLGIVPLGSGNGLARHLRIPMNIRGAVQVIAQKKIMTLDAILINNHASFNVSGIGFDGHVANLFGQSGKRGLSEYIRITLREFGRFKNFPVRANIDNKVLEGEAFMVAVANSSQFGNNAKIAPLASVSDGLLDVVFVKKIPLVHTVGFAARMFTGRIGTSRFVQGGRGKTLHIAFDNPKPFHVDGEGMGEASVFEIAIKPGALKVLAG